MTLEEYLESSEEYWFLTGKKEYTVQAMMVSEETSFHNELEDVDYTVTDDGTTVILKGTAGDNVLHTNFPTAPHGEGDYLVCRIGENGGPDLTDVWVVNGVLFPENYDTTNK